MTEQRRVHGSLQRLRGAPVSIKWTDPRGLYNQLIINKLTLVYNHF